MTSLPTLVAPTATAFVAAVGGCPARSRRPAPRPYHLTGGGVNIVARRLLVVDSDQRVRQDLVEKAALLGHDVGAVS